MVDISINLSDHILSASLRFECCQILHQALLGTLGAAGFGFFAELCSPAGGDYRKARY